MGLGRIEPTLSLWPCLYGGADKKTDECDDIGDHDACDGAVVSAGCPGEPQERRHTRQPRNEGHSLKRRLERGVDQEDAKQTEDDRAMAHEDGKVRVDDGQAVEGQKPFGPEVMIDQTVRGASRS